MDAVIKVGGSLIEKPQELKALARELDQIGKNWKIAVVPGGGSFADRVRELEPKFNLPANISHRMAILAMDQYGLALSSLIPNSCCSDSFRNAVKLSREGRVVIFLPSKVLNRNDPFDPSWDVTSDSIAAYLALKLKAAKAIFVTDVDGIFTENPKERLNAKLICAVSASALLKQNRRTSVDMFLPKFILQNPSLDCYVVNGRYPQRIKSIILGHQSVCTRILVTPNEPQKVNMV